MSRNGSREALGYDHPRDILAAFGDRLGILALWAMEGTPASEESVETVAAALRELGRDWEEAWAYCKPILEDLDVSRDARRPAKAQARGEGPEPGPGEGPDLEALEEWIHEKLKSYVKGVPNAAGGRVGVLQADAAHWSVEEAFRRFAPREEVPHA